MCGSRSAANWGRASAVASLTEASCARSGSHRTNFAHAVRHTAARWFCAASRTISQDNATHWISWSTTVREVSIKAAGMAREKVIVGMSGGVDSSVAAWLLKERGFEVVGLFMKNWEDDDTDEYCTSRADLVDAASVADIIGIELEAVNFAREYRERVFAHFLREYEAGRTPNPDVLCNSEIKFRAFLDHARALGAVHVATGHYARVRNAVGRIELLKGADVAKDQSYFLHRLTQAQLAPVLFPLGDMSKRDMRELARREGIPTWAKKDSTGICFIGERPFRDFLAR